MSKHVGSDRLFDLFGELEDAYEKAQSAGDDELMQTLDILELWKEHPVASDLYVVWRALKGDSEAQRNTAWFFDWDTEKEKNEKYDRPGLAAYWYEMAARQGDAIAQCNLANLYCSGADELWDGRRAVYWREKSAAQKEPYGMRGLAYCLECGKCCPGGADPVRARALRREADEILKTKGDNDDRP